MDGHVINILLFCRCMIAWKAQRYVGKPPTELHYNPETQRYEQYFENLGMYWLESEGPEHVRLLNYGAWKCDALLPLA